LREIKEGIGLEKDKCMITSEEIREVFL